MVVFTCNNCGQSVRKNQVEKHYLQCRTAKSLSCMDCGKDFYGEEFRKHMKCISEDQKYGGKDYVPQVNKGEVKQEQWIEHVKHVIATTTMSPQLSNLMEQLMEFNNIPRKKIKFENFIKNSVRVRNPKIVAEAWEIFSSAHNPKAKEEKKKEISEKRKLENSDDEGRAKKKPKKFEDSETVSQNGAESGDDDEMVNGDATRKRFKWKKVIVQVLRQAADNELAVKKLRKKVLAEYMAYGESGKPLDGHELLAKFEKKMNNNPNCKVFKDRVKLKE